MYAHRFLNVQYSVLNLLILIHNLTVALLLNPAQYFEVILHAKNTALAVGPHNRV